MKTLLILLICCTGAWPLRAATDIPARQVQEAVRRFVLEQTQVDREGGERLEVATRWRVPLHVEESGEPRIVVQRISSKPLWGPTVLRVEVQMGGRTVREMSVTADVRHLRPVLVAACGMRRGETPDPERITREERDVTHVRGSWYTEKEQLRGLRLKRSVQAGAILTDRHTEPIPVVARGTSVQLIARTPHLCVTAPAVALQDGGVGQRIRVRNVDSGTVLYGHVLDAHQVEVRLP